MCPVDQLFCLTIYVAQFLPSHFSPTVYVKLFALSAPAYCLVLMPYVNVACFHCPACAAMLMIQLQEVTSARRLMVRLKVTLIWTKHKLWDNDIPHTTNFSKVSNWLFSLKHVYFHMNSDDRFQGCYFQLNINL